MKITLTVLMAFVCLNALSQTTVKYPLPLTKDSVIEYRDVVKLDSTYKSGQIYSSTKSWFVNNFKSAKAVIQSDDIANGRLLAKAFVLMHQKGFTVVDDPEIYFTVQIDVKDGRYRYRFYNLYSRAYLMNTAHEEDLSKFYMDYLHDKYHKGLMSRKKAEEKINYMFESVDVQIKALIANLNSEIAKGKTDNF